MGLLDSLLSGGNLGGLGNLVGGGNLSKPLGIAALALMAYRDRQSGGSGGGGMLGQILGAIGQSGTAAPSAGEAQQALPDGLGSLVQRFQQSGLGDVVQSWIGSGPNQSISPDEVHRALGSDAVNELSQQTGTPREDLLSELAQALPGFIDRMTPNGRVPDQSEAAEAMNRPIEV